MSYESRIHRIEDYLADRELTIEIPKDIKDIDKLTSTEVDYFYELLRRKSNFPTPDIDSWNEEKVNNYLLTK